MRNVLGAVAIVCTLQASSIHAAPQIESDPRIQELERAANTKGDPESWYFLAAYCSEKSNETALRTSVARAYVIRGLEADDRALAMNMDYYDAVVLKSVLLRQRVKHENVPYVRALLDAEAAVYSFRAAEIAKKMQPRVGPPRPRY